MAEDKLDTCVRRSTLEFPNIVIARLKRISISESASLKPLTNRLQVGREFFDVGILRVAESGLEHQKQIRHKQAVAYQSHVHLNHFRLKPPHSS